MSDLINGINLRVYGILWSPARDAVLVIDEHVLGKDLRKFPGGGVEFTEAPGVALAREFQEELGVKIDLGPLLYVSPHFHRSLFRPQQLLALYWEVHLQQGESEPKAILSQMSANWREVQGLREDEMTHPVDREVVRVLKGRCVAK